MPFCLCWANENWTRRWDGCESDVLVAQNHSSEDDLAFISYIEKYLRDPRYIRIDGKPLLIVYRPALLPDPEKTAKAWRAYCRESGLGEIYLVSTTSFEDVPPSAYGFDALVEFAPNNSNPTQITDTVRKLNPEFAGNVYDWRCLVERSRNYIKLPYRLFRGVNPGWDNTPRKADNGNIFLHSSPRGYEEWLFNAVRDAVDTDRHADERLVFVNAWNEWAEGAYLEPDARLGYAYLAATRRALQRAAQAQLPAASSPHKDKLQRPICVVIHAFYPELLGEMFDRLARWRWPIRLIVTCPAECRDQVLEQLEGRAFDAECRVFENRGRDILPFLHVANELADGDEELVVKLHTKRSPHRIDGDTWRRDLLDKLIAPKHAKTIHAAFGNTQDLGIVGPEGHVLPLSFYWGSNEANVQYLCRIMGIPEVNADAGVFCAGSMFWARVSALRPLLDAYLDESAFEIESGQVDGTLAHAIERCLAPAARSVGYFLASSTTPSVPATPLGEEYDYAESSRVQAAVSTGL
ncbi:MAG: glycoside hydrolase family 99-like domain-containing protein [Xanthomonadales bacterium]|nr:glycoside hydrolase family 99-like domain-containing protein [Xanthomonadales bacterium]